MPSLAADIAARWWDVRNVTRIARSAALRPLPRPAYGEFMITAAVSPPRPPLATLVPAPALEPPMDNPLLGDWLLQHREAMFRWAMALAGEAPAGSDLEARRTFAETAVAVQRLHGAARFVTWLYGESLLAAQRHALDGRLPEPMLAGLPPELRALLRLVSRGALRAEAAWAMLPEPMAGVRQALVRARLARPEATAELAGP